ncbi:glycosyltransferase [Actinomadura latina]|uniref:Glycosyltransferase family 1 protein n=1 Tax=Actinomadura latina TaxID=163603 RepID=A0A846YYC7_9ACTN|nr:glycosyltransferase [Actinomadura latina]NKZ03594.1 glycosyltransferase family 1 protein [Actinomadura latina]
MSGWLLLTWDGAGNQGPMIALAQHLAARGHKVTFAGYAGQRARFERAGFAFRPLPRADAGYPAAPPPEGWLPALVGAVWACPEQAADVEEALADGSYDGVVADCLMFGALARLETSEIPAAVLVHSAPGALCPPGQAMDQMLLPAVNALRGGAGRPALERLWDAWKPFPTLCASVRELDPLADQAPFDYVGPMFEEQPPSGWQPPWPADDPRPLVVAGFSTGLAWDQTSRIQRTLDAFAAGGPRLLITTGMMDAAGLRVPENATVLAWLPHAEILPHAAAVVTHAGHGTVAAALAHGAPVVALPNPAADQPILAGRAAGLGAGIALDGEAADPGEIAAAVRTVIDDPSYRAAALSLAGRIAAAPGPAAAAGRLERLLGNV